MKTMMATKVIARDSDRSGDIGSDDEDDNGSYFTIIIYLYLAFV